MGAAGSVVAIVFGIFWTIMAYQITKDAPFPMVGTIFPLFGVLFIILGAVQAVFHYKNATGRRRMSLLDITEDGEEPDPLETFAKRHHHDRQEADWPADTDGETGAYRSFDGHMRFCPYCGNKTEEDYAFCPSCGKPLRQ